ncbi:sigma-70 family RNA polymerase sigma factor [Candidatus Peregrinibacteria bacterium]|jgi:RNA polymerase sigma-70 factor, ECF subfamily|nr:sigma-70 family RNA polymerase sigma factor [Candidatus Peregrinibacteria bacterium]MBT4632076.1 sigma-70 family RNA polymerase sigma factor [Candidatus Peregrinibacteria bacterium]MBT5517089.1 sigma-70 family RNA polymerase sigma factor [Candidatus Peregrinibacteria bacterium]MBT5823730.1 sigma-70 family RNA polymerase sigma factor [Candidatus Peregrinibacteria bacterium]
MSTPGNISDIDIDALILSAQEGDKDAYGQVYDHFFEKIYRYVHFRVVPKEVEDIVENVFIKSWVNLEKYEKRDVSFGAWLFRIAHNAVIDHRRAHRSILPIDPSMADKTVGNAPQKRTERSLMAEKIREEVDKLREPYKQVITLKFLSGLSNSEIAEILGQTEGNIRVLQFRALKELKIGLGEKGISAEFL